MSIKFDMLNAIRPDVGDVRAIKEARGVGLIEAVKIARADALHSELTNMRYRMGRFEEMSDREVLDQLLDLMIAGIKDD